MFKPNTTTSSGSKSASGTKSKPGVLNTPLLTTKPGTYQAPLVLSAAGKKSAGTLVTGVAASGSGKTGPGKTVTSAVPATVMTPKEELAKLNSALASQTKQYKADMAQLTQEETTLTQQKGNNQGFTNFKLTTTGYSVTAADAQVVANEQRVVNDAKAKMDADQSSVTAEGATQKTASTYHESAPPVTATTGLSRTMTGVTTAAANNTKKKQAQVNDDRTNLANTNAAVSTADHLAAQDPMMAGKLIGSLGQSLKLQGQQTATLKTDTKALTTAQHNQSAVDNAVGVVEYSGQKGSQTAVDESTFNTQLKQLQKSGVLNSKGILTKSASNPTGTVSGLTGGQQVQFEQLIATGDKVSANGTDAAAFNQALAGLKLDASLYGSTTKGAVSTVNKALSKYRLQLSTPKAEPVSKARAQVTTANAQAKQADMQWDVDSRAASTDEQQQKVSQLAGEVKSQPDNTTLVGQLHQQDTTLEKDLGSYGQAKSYQGENQESTAYAQDTQAVSTAQKRYDADPTSQNLSALRTAQAQQSQAKAQGQIDADGLITSSAQVDGAQQLGAEDLDGQLTTALGAQPKSSSPVYELGGSKGLPQALPGETAIAQQAGTAAAASGQAGTFSYWSGRGGR